MSSTSAVSSSSASNNTSASKLDTQANAFRNADFLKIMLSELSHQDPMKPQETSQIVENMQKLQELANTQYTKFRADVSWGQQLLGQTVNVQQMIIDDKEKQKLLDQGVRPNVGYGNLDGEVSSFRQVGETVYVSIGNYDYPIDNVRQVRPKNTQTPDHLAGIASNLVGRTVSYKLADGTSGAGRVSAVAYDDTGAVMMTINGAQVPYQKMTRIGE